MLPKHPFTDSFPLPLPLGSRQPNMAEKNLQLTFSLKMCYIITGPSHENYIQTRKVYTKHMIYKLKRKQIFSNNVTFPDEKIHHLMCDSRTKPTKEQIITSLKFDKRSKVTTYYIQSTKAFYFC